MVTMRLPAARLLLRPVQNRELNSCYDIIEVRHFKSYIPYFVLENMAILKVVCVKYTLFN